jgi:hypothetical protein
MRSPPARFYQSTLKDLKSQSTGDAAFGAASQLGFLIQRAASASLSKVTKEARIVTRPRHLDAPAVPAFKQF